MAITAEIFAGASGKTVIARFLSNGQLTNLTSAVGNPTIRINGGSPVALTVNLWESRTEDVPTIIKFPHVLYWLPSGTLLVTDTVTFTDSGGGPAAIAAVQNGPDWGSVSGSGYRGDYRYATAGDGSSDAVWTFTGLTPGTYRVSATWVEHSNRATNTPFTVYDNTTPFTVVRKTQETAPNDFLFDGVNWEIIGSYVITSTTLKVQISNDADQFVIADGILIERTDVVGFIAVGDNTASSSTPAYTTEAGAAPTITAQSVDCSRVGASNLMLEPPSGRTMAVGTNITTLGAAFEPVLMYANVMRGCIASGNNTTSNANGYPNVGYSPGQIRVVYPENAFFAKGFPSGATGTYTLRWDGPGLAVIASNDGDVSVTQTAENLTGGAGNWRTFNVVNNGANYGLSLYLFITDTSGITKWELYPPGVATDGSQKFHPNVITSLQNRAAIRPMGMITTGNDPVIDYADYSRSNQASYVQSLDRYRSIPITRIDGYDSTTNVWINQGWQRYLVTTTSAHGLRSGDTVQLLRPSNTIPVTLANGFVHEIAYAQSPVIVISSTTFVFAMITWDGATDSPPTLRLPTYQTVSTPFTHTDAYALLNGSAGSPAEDVVELANSAGCDLWMNVSPFATDTCVTTLFEMIADNLNANANCYAELSNEHWNNAIGFEQYKWFAAQANARGLVTAGTAPSVQATRYYMIRSGEIHALARAAFVAKGRAASQVKRVFGSQFWGTGITTTMATYAASNSIPMDYLALAPYFGNLPRAIPGFDYENLTVDECMDVLEQSIYASRPIVAEVFAGHRAELAASGYSATELLCYEGGIAYAGLSGTALTNGKQSLACQFSPRMKNVYYEFFDIFNDEDIPLFMRYSFSNQPFAENAQSQASLYHELLGTIMQAGVGDGSDGKADNRTGTSGVPAAYPVLPNVVSVVTYALDLWNATGGSTNAYQKFFRRDTRGRGRPPVRWGVKPRRRFAR